MKVTLEELRTALEYSTERRIMRTETDNIILARLNQIVVSQDAVQEDVRQLTRRMSSLEDQVIQVHRAINGLRTDIASINDRFDNFNERCTRIERRLHLPELRGGRSRAATVRYRYAQARGAWGVRISFGPPASGAQLELLGEPVFATT